MDKYTYCSVLKWEQQLKVEVIVIWNCLLKYLYLKGLIELNLQIKDVLVVK